MVKQLEINVNGITISEDVIVIETLGYNVLLGNSWLNKANAIIDYKLNQLTVESKGQITTIPITCAERIDPRFFTQIYNEIDELELEEETEVNPQKYFQVQHSDDIIMIEGREYQPEQLQYYEDEIIRENKD